MDCSRNNVDEVIEYLKSCGLEVNLNTQARGHQGFLLKNRIDISKKTPKDKIIQILLHEFAHYIHSLIEPDVNKTKGSIQLAFNTNEDIFEQLVAVTNSVDKNSKFELLKNHKNLVKSKILQQEKIIKSYYPNFQRSKKFKEFDKFIKFSKAKYLLKYDRVKYITPFLKRVEYYSVDTLEKDFKITTPFAAYIRLKSYQRKQTRISAKINRLKKYYTSPTELFARFVESYYLDRKHTETIAPNAFKAFQHSLDTGYYLNLKEVLFMASK